MAEYARRYEAYDDDRQYDRCDDYDDFDEAEQALFDQVDEDNQLVWKVQVHELAHAMRAMPLPGTSLGEEWHRRFHQQFTPLPPIDRNGGLVRELRNLFDDFAYEQAKEWARSDDRDIAWFAAKSLHWRNEAIGRYCFNVNCLAALPEQSRRRGRPRCYCDDKCKDADIKRRKYHKAKPNAAHRTRAMLVAGFPFPARERSEWGSGIIPPRTDYKAPWCENVDDIRSDNGAPEVLEHFRRWLSKHRKNRQSLQARDRRKTRTAEQTEARRQIEAVIGLSLETAIQMAVNDGHIFEDDERTVIEELLGQSIHGLITGEGTDDNGPAGVGPLAQYEAE